MKPGAREYVARESADVNGERLKALQALYPGAFSVDPYRLRQALGQVLDDVHTIYQVTDPDFE